MLHVLTEFSKMTVTSSSASSVLRLQMHFVTSVGVTNFARGFCHLVATLSPGRFVSADGAGEDNDDAAIFLDLEDKDHQKEPGQGLGIDRIME